jgi:hypothetical protein
LRSFSFFRSWYLQSSCLSFSCRINVCMKVREFNSSQRISIFRLWMSLDLNIKLITRESFKLIKYTSMMRSRMRKLNKIFDVETGTFNWREILLLIFEIITIFRRLECASTKVKEWLWCLFIIFKNQISLFFSLMITREKEHFIALMIVCLRFWSRDPLIFSSRSHINQIFLVSSSLNFLMKRKTTS